MFLLTLSPAEIAAWLIAFAIALSVHECAHAAVALFFGDPTAKMEGRVTLNPLRHVDPAGMVFLVLVGFGWGRPVPVNPRNFEHPRFAEISTAFAGPLANIATAFLFAIPANLFGADFLFADLFHAVMYLNIALAVFNLLPVFPLDGGNLIGPLLPYHAREQFEQYGPIVLFSVIAFDWVFKTDVLWQFLGPAIDIVWAGINLATRFGG